MTTIAIGWVMISMVAVLATAAAAHVPRRWPLLPYLAARVAILLLPCGFTGWALAQMGVNLAGGGS
jgi:hypothetical protein